MPPPPSPAVLPLMTVRWTVSEVPVPTAMPPPSFAPEAVFPLMTESCTVTVSPALPTELMPPPSPTPLLFPFVIVTPVIVTAGTAPARMSRILKLGAAPSRVMVRLAAPGPVMVTGDEIWGRAVNRLMVDVGGSVKTMSSAPAAVLASITACRRLPAPASLVLVTVKVTAEAGPAPASTAPTVKAPEARALPAARLCFRCSRRSRNASARRSCRVPGAPPTDITRRLAMPTSSEGPFGPSCGMWAVL